MESIGLPVLTEETTFQQLSIGEDFYLAGEPVRYHKVSGTHAVMSHSYNFQTYAQLAFEPGWKVWRRIEP